MPDNSANAAALASVISSASNSIATSNLNRRNRKWSEQMYERQQGDNIEFWNMQNEYNSPQAQMARFQEAGLNPNLIYGQGNAGNASPISTPDVQPVNLRNPEYGNAIPNALSALTAMYDLDIKQAQVDNMRVQNTVLEQDALLRSAQIGNLQTQTERGRFDLDFESEMRNVSADARREHVRQLSTSTDLSLRRDFREAAQNASSLSEAAERIKTMVYDRTKYKPAERDRIIANIDILRKEGILKQMDIDMRKNGMTWQDPLAIRFGAKLLESLLNGKSDLLEGIKGKIPQRQFNPRWPSF